LSAAAAVLLLLEFPSKAFLMKLLQELEAEGGSPAAEKTTVS